MVCKHCGAPLGLNDVFCGECGTKVVHDSAPLSTPAPNSMPIHTPPVQPAKKSNAGAIIGVIIAVVVVLIGLAGTLVYFTFFADRQSTSTTQNNPASQPVSVPTNPQTPAKAKPEIERNVNEVIASYGVTGNVGVAVVDNLEASTYLCAGSKNQYTSWGFYLPVYMAFCDQYPSSYETYKADIMSGDAAKCNAAANYAIDACGGTTAITSYIQSTMNYPLTVVGRKYGDIHATQDNYSTAEEAARMLSEFVVKDSCAKLCYNPTNFGITVPAGATMYAQLGTEDLSVKENLNVFAVVKGTYSDYCIAIMTQENASGTGVINDILSTVHTLMEGYAQ